MVKIGRLGAMTRRLARRQQRQSEPDPPRQVVRQTPQKSKQRRKTEQRQAIDKVIAERRNEITRLNAEQRLVENNPNISETKKERLRDSTNNTVTRLFSQIDELKAVRGSATGQFTTESLIRSAFGKTELIESRGEATEQQVTKVKSQLKKVLPPKLAEKRARQIVRGGRLTLEEQGLTPTSRVKPTATEIALNQSLPSDLRNLPVEQARIIIDLERRGTPFTSADQPQFTVAPEPVKKTPPVVKFFVDPSDVVLKPVASAGEFISDAINEARTKKVERSSEDVIVGKGFGSFAVPRGAIVDSPVGDIGLGVTEIFIPDTVQEVKDVGVAGATIFSASLISPFAQAGVLGTFSGIGVKGALDNSASVEERIASGIVGVGSGLGAISSITPKLKLIGAKKSTETKLGVERFEFKDLVDIKKADAEIIGLGFESKVKIDVPFKTKDINLDIIPSGGQQRFGGEKAKPRLRGDPEKIFEEFKTDIPRKDIELPKVGGSQKDLLKVIKGGDEIVSGSFAQSSQIKKSRPFADLDILSKDLSKTAGKIEQTGKFVVEKKTITDSPLGEFDILKVKEKKTGKTIADIDPLKFAEEGLASKGKVLETKGIKFLDVETRLQSKLIQATRVKKGQPRLSEKVIEDVRLLTSGKVDLGVPSIKGAFGFSEAEMLSIVGKKVDVTSSAIGLFKGSAGESVVLKPQLFGTPTFKEVTSFRISRLLTNPKESSGFTFTRQGDPQVVLFKGKKINPADVKIEGEFRASVQPRGELEVIAEGTAVNLGKVKTLNVKGTPVSFIEGGIVPTKSLGFSGAEAKLLTKFKSGSELSLLEKKSLASALKEKTGIDITRDILPSKTFISPTGFSSAISSKINLRADLKSITRPKRKGTGFKLDTRRLAIPNLDRPLRGLIQTPKRGTERTPPPSRPPTRRPPTRPPLRFPPSRPPTRRPPTRPPLRFPPELPPTKRPPLAVLRKKKKKRDELVTGFKTFVIKGGKEIPLEGLRTRGGALKKGARRVRTSLRATFKIKPTKILIPKQGSIGFKPSRAVFRTFKRRKGRKIALQDTFIQRRGKRLASPLEVKDIQRAVRRKL